MKYLLFIIFIISIVVIVDGEPSGKITVGNKIRISESNTRPQWETIIAVDPENPKNMLACWNDGIQFAEPTSHTVVYSSFDGGKTWKKALDIPKPGTYSCDPTCVYGPGGVAYASAHGQAIYRSSDSGKTWTEANNLRVDRDREWIAVDNTGSKNHGRVYYHYKSVPRSLGALFLGEGVGIDYGQTLDLWYSTDFARTFWGPAKIVLDTNYTYFASGSKGAILSDGTFFTAVAPFFFASDARYVPTPSGDHRVVVVQLDENDNRNFSPSTTVDKYNPPNFLLDCWNMPVIVSDTSSGKFNDRLYVMWTDARSGRPDLIISHSSDRGKTWSVPKSVKNGVMKEAGSVSCVAGSAVNKEGVLGIIWREQISHPEATTRNESGFLENVSHETWFTASLDGGENFLPPVKLSEKVLPKFYRIGETIGLDVDSDGNFHGLWVENRTGVPQIYYAPIRVSVSSSHTATNLRNKGLKDKIYNDELRPKILSGKPLDWDALEKQLVAKYGEVGREAVFKARPDYYFRTKDWLNVHSTLVTYIREYGSKDLDAMAMNNYAWAVFENVADKKILKDAAAWSLISLQRQNNEPEAIDTYSNILYRMGKKKEAVRWQEKAVAGARSDADKKRFQAVIDKMKKGEPTWPVK